MIREAKIREANIRVPRLCEIPRSLWTWPEMSGESKMAAIWIWNNLEGKPGYLSFRMSDLASAAGRSQERGARRWLGYLVNEEIVEVVSNERGLFVVYMHDPDELAQKKADELLRRRGRAKKSIKGEPRKEKPANLD